MIHEMVNIYYAFKYLLILLGTNTRIPKVFIFNIFIFIKLDYSDDGIKTY